MKRDQNFEDHLVLKFFVLYYRIILAAAQPKKEKGKKGLAAKIAAREAREKKEREMKNMTPQERHALEMKQQEEDAMAMASDLVANVTVEDPDRIS